MKRTHTCGELNKFHIGKMVFLCGWVQSWRDHGGVIFIDLRDREGLTQVVFSPEENKELHLEAHRLKDEDVIAIGGRTRERPEGTENPKISTGEIEVVCKSLKILNKSLPLPFAVADNAYVSEDLRFRYRYLDLRRPFILKKLTLRHKVCTLIRSFLDKEGFIEAETPILTKPTPEGARDYIVPSRVNPGSFYALPQSPQLFKQILMVGGMEKYFQLARCFRDEDLRADRQPEFTQLDIEMSFVDENDIIDLTERLVAKVFKEARGADLTVPFTRLSYKEAMARFGMDKPDIRFGMELVDISQEVNGCGFKTFTNVLAEGGVVRGINAKGCGEFSRTKVDNLVKKAIDSGAKGLAWFKVIDGKLDSQIKKFFDDGTLNKIAAKMSAENGDLLLMVGDKEEAVYEPLVFLRKKLAQVLKLIDKNKFAPLWVLDFPLLTFNKDEKKWETEHHPFTSPKEEDISCLDSEPGRVYSRAYDLVINGFEIAGGSIRIHSPELQRKMFEIIGLGEEEARLKFGFLLEALSYGAPPHGGIAAGLDRLVSLLSGDENIREVIAFPKTQKAVCPLTGAPSSISPEQLKELGVILSDDRKLKT